MRILVGCAAVLALSVSAVAVAQDKVDAKKLVGKWTTKDTKTATGLSLEFRADGKVSLSVVFNGQPAKADGTYKVDGDKIEVALKYDAEEKKDTLTVVKLTDAELETTDRTGKKDLFTRVADKPKEREKDKKDEKKDDKKTEQKDKKDDKEKKAEKDKN